MIKLKTAMGGSCYELASIWVRRRIRLTVGGIPRCADGRSSEPQARRRSQPASRRRTRPSRRRVERGGCPRLDRSRRGGPLGAQEFGEQPQIRRPVAPPDHRRNPNKAVHRPRAMRQIRQMRLWPGMNLVVLRVRRTACHERTRSALSCAARRGRLSATRAPRSGSPHQRATSGVPSQRRSRGRWAAVVGRKE